jgi:hypothetical protein
VVAGGKVIEHRVFLSGRHAAVAGKRLRVVSLFLRRGFSVSPANAGSADGEGKTYFFGEGFAVKSRTTKSVKLAAAVGLVSLVGSVAQASLISFDPDGAAAANGPIQIATFDFAPGNSIAVDAVPLASLPSS